MFPNYNNGGALEQAIQVMPDAGDYENFFVKPDTIGQCTGLHDKNGTLLFEGDVLSCEDWDGVWVVSWREDWGGYACEPFTGQNIGTLSLQDIVECEYEIVGNIHDNPEFLQEAEHE